MGSFLFMSGHSDQIRNKQKQLKRRKKPTCFLLLKSLSKCSLALSSQKNEVCGGLIHSRVIWVTNTQETEHFLGFWRAPPSQCTHQLRAVVHKSHGCAAVNRFLHLWRAPVPNKNASISEDARQLAMRSDRLKFQLCWSEREQTVFN